MKLELFLRRPLVGGLLGILIASAALAFLPSVWAEYQRFPDQPRRIPFAEAATAAAAEEWVTLIDATVRCADAVRDDDSHYVAMTGSASAPVIVAGTDDVCRDGRPREVTGTLAPMAGRLERDLADLGLAARVDPARPPLMLWTHGGKGNALAGLIMLPILALLGLTIYPLLLRQRRAMERDGRWPPRP